MPRKSDMPAPTEPKDIRDKLRRVREFIDSRGLDAVIIGRGDNFAWLTCGANNKVVRTSEIGFGLLLITKKRVTLVAQVMDGAWLLDDQLAGLDVDYVPLRWYEPSREQKAAMLLKGKRVLSDCPVPGAKVDPKAVYALHYPLTEKEIQRLRWLGRRSEQIIRRVADDLKPGVTERETANRLLSLYALDGIECDVLLVGFDERIAAYRHPVPSDARLRRFALLHPAARKWGLHANITRHVSLGTPSPDRRRRYEAARRIHATAQSMCMPDTRFADILAAEKSVYRQTGFPVEWRNHFQGGITGYLLADPTLCTSPSARVGQNMAFDWFITITGVKSEELGLNTREGVETPSVAGGWPARRVEGADGRSVRLPDILVL